MYSRKILALIFVFGWGVASADTLTLKNGDRITGRVDSISGGSLVIETEYAGLLKVQVTAIATADTEQRFDLKLASGSEINGRLRASDGEQLVATREKAEPLALDEIRRLSEDLTGIVNMTREWRSRADLNAAISRGNSETDSYSVLLESVLKLERQEHNVALAVSREEADGLTTKDQQELDYGYKWFYRDDWFVSGNVEYFKDKLKGIDRRITLGAGLGHQFWDNSLGALSAELGISEVFENLEGGDANNPAVRWALSYNRFLWGKRIEFFHKNQILKILDSDRGEVLNASTGFRFALNDTWDANIRYDIDYETDPPPGNEKTDSTLALGVGLKF